MSLDPITVTTKICIGCEKSLPVTEYKNQGISKYRRSRCYPCHQLQKAEWSRRTNSARKGNLKSKYGLTLEQYDILVQKQQGVCAICKLPEKAIQRGKICSLSVDHCHRTGRVRALLCNNCNTSLGLLKENVDIVSSLYQYIIKNNGVQS